MPGKKIEKPRKTRRKAEAEWQWPKNYRVWNADRKIFLYPENWVEPGLGLPVPFRVSLNELALFIHPRCSAKGVRVLFPGKDRARRLVSAQTLARSLGKNLYRIDLNAVVSEYIGETEKNLRRVVDAAKGSRAVLFFDEGDALFGKRTDVKDNHDRRSKNEINYLLRRSEKYGGLTILANRNRAKINKALLRRFHFIIPIPQRRKLRHKKFLNLLGSRA
jgi:ATPase family associated with various cellular activities (AAA)